MVVESALGAALGVAAAPHALVHGVDRGSASLLGEERVSREQSAHGSLVDPSPVQRRVETAPAAAVHRLQA